MILKLLYMWKQKMAPTEIFATLDAWRQYNTWVLFDSKIAILSENKV